MKESGEMLNLNTRQKMCLGSNRQTMEKQSSLTVNELRSDSQGWRPGEEKGRWYMCKGLPKIIFWVSKTRAGHFSYLSPEAQLPPLPALPTVARDANRCQSCLAPLKPSIDVTSRGRVLGLVRERHVLQSLTLSGCFLAGPVRLRSVAHFQPQWSYLGKLTFLGKYPSQERGGASRNWPWKVWHWVEVEGFQ